jgi:hypothetical protein
VTQPGWWWRSLQCKWWWCAAGCGFGGCCLLLHCLLLLLLLLLYLLLLLLHYNCERKVARCRADTAPADCSPCRRERETCPRTTLGCRPHPASKIIIVITTTLLTHKLSWYNITPPASQMIIIVITAILLTQKLSS